MPTAKGLVLVDYSYNQRGKREEDLADLKDSTSNPISEIMANGQALSDLAARISNRLANTSPTAGAQTVPVDATIKRSGNAGTTQLTHAST